MNTNEERKQPIEYSYNQNDSSVSSFITYLKAAIECKGIKLFNGYTIFIVIFSKDYASSVSCLENLVKHLELSRQDKNVYEVVPLFYGVSRSTVKQQNGTFSVAFTNLERSYDVYQVNKWRCGLEETAKLQGHEYDDNLSEESEFIEEITQAVFEKHYPTEEIGINDRQLEIEDLLCKQPWGLRTLGIFGDPRIGKTVLASAVFRRVVGDYDVSRFVKDFHKEYSEMKLEPLSSDFLGMTLMEEFDLNDSCSEPCYRQRRVLIVLDDVRNAQEAMSFLGDVDQFGLGSLIIITSRDKQVLEEFHVNEMYELNGLNDEDAMKLFTRCAFGNVEIDNNSIDLSMDVIEFCDRNPSTLRAFGEKLKGKTLVEMEKALFRICYDSYINTNMTKSLCFYSNIQEDDEHDQEYASNEHLKKAVLRATQNFIFDLEEHTNFDLQNHVNECLISDLIRVPQVDHSSMQVQSLPQHFHRKQLVLLQRLSCQIYKLWEGYNKSFSRLRNINLRHCKKLVQVSELSNARSLEEIDLQECKSLESIPDTNQLENLQILNLSGCTGIKYFPLNMRTIRELNLEGTGIREIRSESTKFSKLVRQQSTTYNFETYTERFGISKILN